MNIRPRFFLPFFASHLPILLLMLGLTACGETPAERYGSLASMQSNASSSSKPEQPNPVSPAQRLNVNLYIENSGSMNGYVNGGTEFKELLAEIMVDLRHIDNLASLNVIFINEIQRPLDTLQFSLSGFAHSLNPARAPYRVTGVDRPMNTYFDNILDTILQRTDPNTISLLVSDCIYSPHSPIGDPIVFARLRIKDVFWGILEKDPDVIASVYKMNSAFNGSYYPESAGCGPFHYSGQRPYYLWVIGNEAKVTSVLGKLEPDIFRMRGYEAKHIFMTSSSGTFYWSLLSLTGTNDQLSPAKDMVSTEYIRGVESIKTAGGQLEFVIVADLGKQIVGKTFLEDPANYEIISGNYILEEVSPINLATQKIERITNMLQIAAPDWMMIKNSGATHAFFFRAASQVPGNLRFKLNRQIPEWVKRSYTRNDCNSDSINGKTYNFQPLVDGIHDAYMRIGDQPYFTLEMRVMPSSGKGPGGTILTLFLIALIIAIPVFIIKNRK